MGDRSLDDDTQPLGADSVPSGGPDPETTLLTRDAIDRALAALSEDLRVAVVLRDVEGLDYKEIARVTGNGIRFRNWCIRLANQLELAMQCQAVAAGASSFFRRFRFSFAGRHRKSGLKDCRG